jgi:hypothetical protein
MPLPARPYEPVTWKKASVHQDSHVVFERRMYSVPWRLIGREVWVRATPATVAIYCDDEREATHRRLGETAWSTEESHLPAQRAALRHRSRSYWEERAEKIGADVAELVRELFDRDDVLSPVEAGPSHRHASREVSPRASTGGLPPCGLLRKRQLSSHQDHPHEGARPRAAASDGAANALGRDSALRALPAHLDRDGGEP